MRPLGNPGQKIKPVSLISVEARISWLSNRSSIRSLDRRSRFSREPSLSNRGSLINVMSIESDHRVDFYEQLLDSGLSGSKNRERGSLNNNQNRNQQQYYGRNSTGPTGEQQNIYTANVTHRCSCFAECDTDACPCSIAFLQPCLQGFCCDNCIQLKKSVAQTPKNPEGCTCKHAQCLKQYCKCFRLGGVCHASCKCEDCENKHLSLSRIKALAEVSENRLAKTCMCKKTKCLKGYCSCFSAGLKCSKYCQCQGCKNCDMVEQEMEVENEYQGEGQYEQIEMPTGIVFEPFVFSRQQ